tara:strand:- start:82 stop:384 length:303 start_codon:yes stop_codon:yes gene_type:complete
MAKSLKKSAEDNVQRMKEFSFDVQKDLICQEVLETLGVVNDLHKVSAKNVFDDKWRIDVWTQKWFEHACGPSYKIKHSYFCTIKDNCISGCDPEILPLYK